MSPETPAQRSDPLTPSTEFVDVRQLRHPGERPRFWMALATSTLVVGLLLLGVVRYGGWSVRRPARCVSRHGESRGPDIHSHSGHWNRQLFHRSPRVVPSR
jgi:hypothetical protein